MLKPPHQVVQNLKCEKTLVLLNKPFIHGYNGAIIGINSRLFPVKPKTKRRVASSSSSSSPGTKNIIKASLFSPMEKKNTARVSVSVAVQRVTPKFWRFELSEKIQDGLDRLDDLLGLNSLSIELVSAQKDPVTGKERTVKGFPKRPDFNIFSSDDVKYEAKFDIPKDFGEVGAIIVENDFEREIFLKNILLEDLPSEPSTLEFSCNSWVQSKHDVPTDQHKRVFFSNKCYLPSQTPSGIKELRKIALENLRGDGKGERKKNERVYDYDVYNDLGQPDNNDDLKRPVLGGSKEFPYPRRCRTGRPPTETEDKFFWFRDEEFCRQTIAGLNPCCIELVKEWPLKSELDPTIYGPPESKITTELVEKFIKVYGYNNINEALKEKKLFMLDYHDVLLPYVSKVRELENKTLYGSRTLFFLTPYGTLLPLAIELTRPPMDGKPQWKEVYTPMNWHSTDLWLWRLAKAHVLAHDSGVHQLVSHWLRTHCAVEPYIIATNRQLSAMHPIHRLLKPHFRYTMEINALARESLINAGGIIETAFAPGKYSMELSSVMYDKQWRFDLQALPADLIHRGMAVEDKDSEHGVRVIIEDYPYANDGLLIWSSIKQWVTDYVNHYYPISSEVERDEELQAWWTEIRTVGHADKKDAPGWPDLKTKQDLIDIVTNMAWTASAHHAAVNFGQYAYAGYFPNRPTITRTVMPSEEKEYNLDAWKHFKNSPEDALLKCLPTQLQAGLVVAVLDVLSTHSPDEEYLGDKMEPSWGSNLVIAEAFNRFNKRMNEIESIINEKNDNENLRNRHGAGILSYELLKPFSEPGVTNKGNNIIKASLLGRLVSSKDKTATERVTVNVAVQRETAPLIEKPQSLRDKTNDFLGVANFSVELISTQKDPETGKQRKMKCFPESKKGGKKDKVMNYEAKVDIPKDFGDVGAVIIENDFEREIYMKTISLCYDSSDDKFVNFSCESWVQSKRDVPRDQQLRLFFSDKEYERVYDYDVYNDLGDPDKTSDLTRPVLGGSQRPYPRRCRTGRPPAKTDIDKMFKEGYEITDKSISGDKSLKEMLLLHVGTKLHSSVLVAESLVDNVIKFKQPPTADMDKFFWFRDEEFARQTIAGLNPCCLQLVTEWPLKSELDPSIYGPQESKITTEIIEQQLKAYDYTLLDARREKKLYLLDYHDVLLPYVSKVRKLEKRTLYGSRTLFFLTPYGTLMPMAIELTRPPMDGKPQWKEVYTPNSNWHSTDIWLWKLAKAHVLAHDAGVHQLVSHWLRTHCCVEPYVIATNRQLSAMHPINRLLQPHLRGMAVEDETCEHGLRLTIDDYPYANDGLLIWDAIKEWVTEYVKHYYANSSEIESDEELQEWWKEIRTVGHADKKEGWPDLKTREDLIDIVTNIAWIASGHHAAVNFGQYAFSAYFPNRPSLTRTNMPSEEKESKPEVWKAFKANPEDTILKCFPSQLQAAKNMAALDLLSTHASDEEYLGHHVESAWKEDSKILDSFKKFQQRIKQIEDIIDERNDDENLKNRHGAGILPYEFLKPFSEEGITNKGVPYSISI
ncbi:hypothetical protein F8388_005365 [Cannabis sativa]|uniref:Lipoxygenase n=1 Tax=Cannabis sativa TaxID=3483 RepID=A0A7J6ELS2_CANSA|nr:hypothetical protein F8388_005365 [Cannabis sativa]